jgi:hypothetical protein
MVGYFTITERPPAVVCSRQLFFEERVAHREPTDPTARQVCAQIQTAEHQLRQLRAQLAQLQLSCTHVVAPVTRHESTHGYCIKCSYQPPGWYCPDSPDHACHYAEDDTACDNCLYCHQPDARK